MWKEVPLSKYHIYLDEIEAMHEIKVKSSSNCDIRASPVANPATVLFFLFYRQLVARCSCS